jgi:NCAIR mutase (PurE)-related protein
MTVKVKIPNQKPAVAKSIIPPIVGAKPKTENIIVKALKIMLTDVRMIIHPKETKEELEAYREFSNLAYGRKNG